MVKHKRISVTLSKHYYDFLEDLEWNGIYRTKALAIVAAIRLLMKEHGAFYKIKKIEDE